MRINNPSRHSLSRVALVAFTCIVGLLTALPGWAETPFDERRIAIVDGHLDLSGVDFTREVIIATGEWTYAKNHFLSRALSDQTSTTMAAPPVGGIGTYYLRVTMPDGFYGPLLALVPNLRSHAEIAIDGEVKTEAGADLAAGISPLQGVFWADSQNHTVTVTVLRRYALSGGEGHLKLGSPELVIASRLSNAAAQVLVIGSLTLLAFLNIGIFLFLPRRGDLLILGLFCAVVCLRLLVVDERPLLIMFPSLSAGLLHSLDVMSLPIALPLLHYYYFRAFPTEINAHLARISLGVACISTLLIPVALPTLLLTWVPIVDIYLAAIFIVLFYSLICLLRDGYHYSLFYFLSFLIISLSSVWDILFARGLVSDSFPLLLPLCVLAFSVVHAILLGKEFVDGQRRLANVNGELEEAVALRTHDLNIVVEQNRRFLKAINEVAENERKTLSSAIHDGFNSHLMAIKMQSENVLSLIQRGGVAMPVACKEGITESASRIMELASTCYQAARSLTKSLRPEVIDVLGLERALHELASNFQNSNLEITVMVNCDLSVLDEAMSIVIYRVVQECLTNVVKHSNASRCVILVVRDHVGVSVTVSDNGDGAPSTHVTDVESGIGIIGIRENILGLGGTMKVETSPGGGFSVVVRVPFVVNDSEGLQRSL